jgi:putative PIN family toxin of toxin-antitoxin system
VRAVLDPNVIISALLSPNATPAPVLRAWIDGSFEFVVSPQLIDELARALAYPKLARRIPPDEAIRVTEWLSGSATLVADPVATSTPGLSDPGDVYLVALARAEGAALVSGDRHLLDLAADQPIYSPTAFLELLGVRTPRR